MPKIFEYFGFIFYFYSNEHEPIHVHVIHGGKESIFDLIMMEGELSEIRVREKKGAEELSEKEQTVIRMMDADHRLTFDIADVIFDRYEQKLIADDAKRQEQPKKESSTFDSGIDEFWRWIVPLNALYSTYSTFSALVTVSRF